MRRTQVIRYGLLGLPLAFGALPVYLFVPDLYARSGLLGLSAIGLVLMLTRLLDAVADPFFGWVVDRQPRRRILWLALVPFTIGFATLFSPTLMGGIDASLWLFISLALCTLGFSAVMIAYQAWGGDLGVNTQERLQLTGSREAFILAGVVIAAVIPTAVSSDPLVGMSALPEWLVVFLAIALMLIFRLPAGEQVVTRESLSSRLKLAWADKSFCRLLAVFFANGIASSFPATLFIFYVADVLATPEKTGLLLGSYFLAAALAVPFWVRCSQRWGRPAMWMLAMVLAMGSFMGAAFLGPGDWGWFLLICLISGVAVGTDLTLPASMVADLGERNQSTGTYFGIWNLIAKLNLALAAGIALPLLGIFGYEPGAGNQHHVLVAAYVLLPLGLKLIALLLLYRWRKALTISIS